MKTKKWLSLMVCVIASLLVIAGCSNNGSEQSSSEEGIESGGEARTIKYMSNRTENEGQPRVVLPMGQEYAEEHNSDFNIEFEVVEQTNLTQRIQLLASSNDLPEMFVYESAQPLQELIDADLVVDIEEAFTELGIMDKVNPGAVDLLKQLSGGKGLYAIPMELNIEGFWFNKELFEEHNLEVPETWDDLLQVSETLHENGIQPFAVAGQERWPITRYINAYATRVYGVDAMQRVNDGELSITDDGFVEATTMVQDMAQKGYFGQGFNAIDYQTANDIFLNGQAAMLYMGSWVLAELNDEDRNNIGGPENVGFFNVPVVEGGAGSAEDYNMNAGLVTVLAKDKFDDSMKDWVKYLYTNYADRALADHGMISGLMAEEIPEDISPLTRLVTEELNNVQNASLWFEAYFDSRKNDTAEINAQLLANGDMTPEEYLAELE
ncbi:extracellular solute-binding protein [Alkalihalobacillus sp. MEB130]|uniref:ABC transporter substrate-binding protein n=1 Tax=Alkalihalobacillus sp. MEB130 TaxID=2976704 RepID=UPI0028DE323E|nr:extracellular solute-binding protein [Alkalihalobacillus sp. MEB130]MDT8860173.1 extracellular solute-binding protein [Alkalihalobacillus sp. MEB130]